MRRKVVKASLKSARCLMGIVSERIKVERIHHLLRYTLISSAVAWCVWSSFANLSISRITSSVRPDSIMVFRNLASRMNLSWIFKKSFFLHFFLSEFATKYSWSPLLSSRIGAHEVALFLCSSRESKRDQQCAWWTSCSHLIHPARSARTCSGQCRRSSTTGILCTVRWVPHRVVHTIRCFQLL